ncbi:type III restriction endonuclease subunit R [bacterium D16-51]|nr:type III restriction endonuclease subunit R [bacterium D16-59]RKI56559.1 type III restriction endonuclease subunit R [bacterium D16-51]
MKLQFDSKLEYQNQAVSSVVDLFKGQSPMQSLFSVGYYGQIAGQIGLIGTDNGIGNRLELDTEEILENLKEIQLRNGLHQNKSLKSLDFDIEMETGTGKTYVYLRTILELHKSYGFTKFVIVVPSLAIKEGVFKSLDITQEHFHELYDNEVYDYFIYDSNKLGQVRDFAVNDHISIMIINIDAFRKSFADPEKENKANVIHRTNDKMNGMKPIELIQETNPFVIIDEPQSVDTTPKAKEAIASLNPLCILRYSATHVEKHNLVYKLDAVDSFELGLVKQIEVAGFSAKDNHNTAYIRLVSVNNKKIPITAKVEIDINRGGTIKRKIVSICKGDDLYELSNGRDIYEGYIVDEIYCAKDEEYISFTGNSDVVLLGDCIGEIDDLQIKNRQIRKTIEEHLNKELIMRSKGVKVLSLFFIDRVANYRYYDDDGSPQKGIYAKMFEENYRELIRKPKYKKLIEQDSSIEDEIAAHNGYFSQDKKGVLKDTSGKTNADEDAYALIMKDKEKLLSFNLRLRFIFSHSALREGWDNPNVFQICTLNETNSQTKKRQEIGRGLRLCVNQDGQRLYGNEWNTLTVMANESYEEFASTLQSEYEQEEGIRFGYMENHSFSNITKVKENGETEYLGEKRSKEIYISFQNKGYIDTDGRVQDKLRIALKNSILELPEEYEDCKTQIIAFCKKIAGGLNVKNADKKQKIGLNKQVYLSAEFEQLWEQIKYKTTYSVDFDSDKLMERCCNELKKQLAVSSAKMIYTKAKVDVNQGGVEAIEVERGSEIIKVDNQNLPDVVSYLQNQTNLTRRTIAKILVNSGTLDLFKKNPQRYMEETAQIMQSVMRLFIVDGIKYTKIGNRVCYSQELFESEELYGYLDKNMRESFKSPYQYIVYDSDNEKTFAEEFENHDIVKLYAKLPDWFKVPTPLGSYNPDWAVLLEEDGCSKLYFVLETKGNILPEALRPIEMKKIECGHKHFEALKSDVYFQETDSFVEWIEQDMITEASSERTLKYAEKVSVE